VDKVAEDLASGRNAVLRVPAPHIGEGLEKALTAALQRRGLPAPLSCRATPDSLRAAGAGEPSGLPGLVTEALDRTARPAAGPNGSGSGIVKLFLAMTSEGGLRHLLVTGLDSLAPDEQRAVARDMSAWAEETRRSLPGFSGHRGLRIALAAPPVFPMVKDGPFLANHSFWAAVTEADVSRAFDIAYHDSASETQAEYMYLKSVCLAICAEDFDLVRKIVSGRPRNLADIEGYIRDHPLQTAAETLGGRRPAPPAEHPAFSHGGAPERPSSDKDVSLWSEGLLTAWGPRLHPVLLPAKSLANTVAAKQRELFLPLVDFVHSLLVQTAEAFWGGGIWDDKELFRTNGKEYYRPNEDPVDAALTEITPLAFFIKRCFESRKPLRPVPETVGKSTLGCAFDWRAIRKANAHNEVITMDMLAKAYKSYFEFRNNVYDRLGVASGNDGDPRK
jgi:hypothetical protein